MLPISPAHQVMLREFRMHPLWPEFIRSLEAQIRPPPGWRPGDKKDEAQKHHEWVFESGVCVGAQRMIQTLANEQRSET